MTDPMTSLHYTSGGGVANGVYSAGTDGFNLADVSSIAELNELPPGVEGLVWLNMSGGATAAFQAAVSQYIGDPKLYGFYLVDEPNPATVSAANLKAESDWIHSNVTGAKTFIVLQNMGSDQNPIFNYNSANTDIDLFGLDPYPVQTQYNGANLSIIPTAVRAAEAAGIGQNQIVPVYQAFGGGGYASWITPTAAQEQQILATWGAAVPHPAFDYAYSWAVQDGDTALSDSPALQKVFAAHNALQSTPPTSTPPTIPPVTVVPPPVTPPPTVLSSTLTVGDGMTHTLAGATLTGGALKNGGTFDSTGASFLIGVAITNTGKIEASGGTLEISSGSINNTGVLAANGGILDVATPIIGKGSITVGGTGSVFELSGASAESVAFSSASGGLLKLDNASTFSGTIGGLASGDGVDLTHFQFSRNPTIARVTGTGAAGTDTDVTVKDGTLSVTLQLLNQYANEFAASSSAYSLSKDNNSTNQGTLFELAPSSSEPSQSPPGRHRHHFDS